MAEDDIYGSETRYECFKRDLPRLLVPMAKEVDPRRGRAKYYCKNPANLNHFRSLFKHFESRDLSYVRRLRIPQSMRLICHLTSKDFADCERTDIDRIMTKAHGIYGSPKSTETFITDLKHVLKVLFPERDEKGRPDETLVPYVVRHLSRRTDKSRQKLRGDKLSWEEFERLVAYFSDDARIQAYLTLAVESLARPQELLYLRLRNVELRDNYAKIYLSEHGKEGVGLLQCIDSYPYVLKWLETHPLKRDPDSFLFINTGNTNRCKQLKPSNINRLIRKACKDLRIQKPITCYSLKRNGVTLRRLRGESDMEIQHAARWTSTKQLKTYDLSDQEDAFKKELEKRGLLPTDKRGSPKTRQCLYCNKAAGHAELQCPQCKRPLNRSAIRESIKSEDQAVVELQGALQALKDDVAELKRQSIPGLMSDILQAQRQV